MVKHIWKTVPQTNSHICEKGDLTYYGKKLEITKNIKAERKDKM